MTGPIGGCPIGRQYERPGALAGAGSWLLLAPEFPARFGLWPRVSEDVDAKVTV